MKIMWIGGSHSRHLFYINHINKDYKICGAIIEKRENIMPTPPNDILERDKMNYIKHFENRNIKEDDYFGKQKFPDTEILEVLESDLNSEKSVNFVNQIKPDIVLVFGCGLIKEPLYSVLPNNTINLHLGLSPRYRGAATLFWPFYFLEPTYAGSTFHFIISEPDAGDIIHQTVPHLYETDTIHDVACKTVIKSSKEMVKLLKLFEKQKQFQRFVQKSSGKNFLSSDFKPEHLRMIYDVYNDDIVKHYLKGDLKSKKPILKTQF